MVEWDDDKKGLYSIGVVSKIVEINPQTLRLYEKRGLVVPSRSKGNTRLYSKADIEKIRMILTMTRELDVNLAGVEVILNLLDRIKRLEAEYGKTVKKIIQRVMEEFNPEARPEDGALIPIPKTNLKIAKKN